jgi:hypothetical protein
VNYSAVNATQTLVLAVGGGDAGSNWTGGGGAYDGCTGTIFSGGLGSTTGLNSGGNGANNNGLAGAAWNGTSGSGIVIIAFSS